MSGPGLRERKLVSDMSFEGGSFTSLEKDLGCCPRFPQLQCSSRGFDTHASIVSAHSRKSDFTLLNLSQSYASQSPVSLSYRAPSTTQLRLV